GGKKGEAKYDNHKFDIGKGKGKAANNSVCNIDKGKGKVTDDGSSGIAPMAIIDRQLPFEYTITNRSTDAAVPLPVAPAANSATNVLAEWNAIYDAYNEVTCLILGSMTPELYKQFENSSSYDMIKELKFMFEKQDGMKGNVDQLECLGYMLSQDIIVCLILNGLTKDFVGFMRNYNMHNMEKTIGKLHAMLIGYEKGLPKKAETPQLIMIKGGKIQKSKKKSLKAKGKGKANGKGNNKQVYIPKPKNPKPSDKEYPTKDDICHHCKEVGYWKRNCPVYLTELLKKKKQVGSASSSVSKNNVFYFNAIPSNGIYEIDMHDLVPNVNSIYNVSTKRDKQYLDSTYLWHYHLAHINKKHIEKLQQEGILKPTYGESFDQCGCEALLKQDTPDKLQQRSEVSERAVDLKEIQDEDTSPSEITSKILIEVEGFKLPQEEVILICRSVRTHQAPDCLCLHVEVEEHSLGDLNEPTSYKVAMLDS
nr:hypothetical protein [Tanacetum cinerariifolium]